MAATSQRVFRRPGGKPGPYQGNSRGVGPKEHFTPPPAMSSPTASLPGVYSNPDMAYALVAIVGCVVDVQMQSGVAYQGVLKAVSPKLSVALALAHDKAHQATRENTEKLMQLEFADIVSVSVMPESNSSLSSKDIFKTDTEISRSNGSGFSKELQPFSFDDDGSGALTLHGEGGRGWSAEDMFEINKSKFNVESSFDEELSEYTTKLDRSTKDFQEREERAKRLAREIEINMDRHGIDDTGTEEELFSAVVRGEVAPGPISFSKAAQGKATPPTTSSSSSSQSRHPPPTTSSEGSEGATASQTSRGSDDATDTRLAPKAPLDINHLSPPSQGGLSQSQMSSSQEYHMVESTDTDSGNIRGGWTSQESALSLTEEGAERVGGAGDQCRQVELVVAEDEREEGEGEEVETEVGKEEEKDMEGVVTHEVVEKAVEGAVSSVTAGVEGGGGGEGEVVVAEKTVEMTTPPPISASTELDQKSEEKEKKVRDFRLDPNAKSFSFNPGAKEFVPSSAALLSLTGTSPLVQSASSPSVLDSSSYPPLTHTPPMGGKKYPNKPRGGGMAGGGGPRPSGGRSHTYNPQDSMSAAVDYSGGGGSGGGGGGGGYMFSPTSVGGGATQQGPATAAAVAAAIRTSLQQSLQPLPNQQQMLHYSTSMPQFIPPFQPGGYLTPQQQAVMAGPQHMGQKFVGDISPQHQVYPGNQQYMHLGPHQLLQPQQQQQQSPMTLVPAGSQPQFTAVSTHAGLVTSPTAMMLVQQPTGQAPPTATPGGAMYAPAAHMQMAGMPMPQQVGMVGGGGGGGGSGGQNPVLTQPPQQTRYNNSSTNPAHLTP